MQTGNFTVEFAALPADFGPDIPEQGLSGLLTVSRGDALPSRAAAVSLLLHWGC